jgi:hypothetical protein
MLGEEVVEVELIVGALVVIMDDPDDRDIHGSDYDEILAARCASL